MTHEDPYTDPTTGVLLNLLNIKDHETLRAAERDIAFHRDDGMRRRPIPGEFDREHLCAYHRGLFGDLYEWAGTPRRVNIFKEDSLFAHWKFVESALDDIFGKLRAEKLLIDLGREDYLTRFTHYFTEVNVIHPFREGNGRTQRAFFRHLAAHAGWELDITHLVGPHFIDACKAGMFGQPAPLAELFAAAIR